MIKRTERGWAGHFCAGHDCEFRRNTLLEKDNRRVVVSTVGNYKFHGKVTEIGNNRYYETMVFLAKFEDPYWEANVSRQVEFVSPWSIDVCKRETDLAADDMHETVVKEVSEKLEKDELVIELKWNETKFNWDEYDND
jgi:hypothetical protein